MVIKSGACKLLMEKMELNIQENWKLAFKVYIAIALVDIAKMQ